MVEATDAVGAVSWREILRLDAVALRERARAAPGDTWTDDPAALLALATAHRNPGATNPYAAEPYLDAADDLVARGVGDPALRVLAPIVRATALRELGRLVEARALLARALVVVAEADLDFATRVELRALALLHDGVTAMLQGRLVEARHALMRSLHVADTRTPAAHRTEAWGCIALIDLRVGSLRNAEADIQRARAASAALGPWRLSAAPMELAEVAVAIERGSTEDLDTRIEELLLVTAGTEYEPLARATLAELHDTVDEAVLEVLQELQLSVREWTRQNLPMQLHDECRIEHLVRHREVVAARAAIDRVRADESHSQCPATWRARLALDAGEPTRAIELTAECLAMGDAHAPRTAVAALLVAASAHAALGDPKTADALFANALGIAAPSGAIRAFGALPRSRLRDLVGRARVGDMPREARHLLDTIERTYPADGAVVPDTLSIRERVVLEHLVAGETQQRISFSLSVSPNTVKTQVRSIYRKLGVRTREGAVQRARTLGLID